MGSEMCIRDSFVSARAADRPAAPAPTTMTVGASSAMKTGARSLGAWPRDGKERFCKECEHKNGTGKTIPFLALHMLAKDLFFAQDNGDGEKTHRSVQLLHKQQTT